MEKSSGEKLFKAGEDPNQEDVEERLKVPERADDEPEAEKKVKGEIKAVPRNAVAEKFIEEKTEDTEREKKKREEEKSGREKKKFDFLMKKIKASDVSKRHKQQKKGSKQKKSKKKVEYKQLKKKSFTEMFKERMKSLFGGTKAGKARKTAENKLTKKNNRLGDVADGDDALPGVGIKEHEGYDDCWIMDPAVLTDRSHRADLDLVVNNDNGGQLWHENKRPFWRNKTLQSEVPPKPDDKTISKILIDVINKKQSIADPAPDPSPFFTDNMKLDELALKDEIWFKEPQVLGNTIRSIIGAIEDSEIEKKTPAEHKTIVVFKEPTTLYSYYRHDISKKELLPFLKSLPGKPRRLKKSNTSSSTSSTSSTSTGPKAGSPKEGKTRENSFPEKKMEKSGKKMEKSGKRKKN